MNKKISDMPMIEPDEIKNISEIPVLFIRKTGDYEVIGQQAWDDMKFFIKENNLEVEIF